MEGLQTCLVLSKRTHVTSYLKKTRVVWKYPRKNLYNNSVAFHSIVMLVMLCVFLSRVWWLPKRGPTWPHKSCFDCALMLTCRRPHHAHVSTLVTMVYIGSFVLSFNPNNSPFYGKKTSINRTRFLNNFPLALRLRIRIGMASRGVVHWPQS